MSTFLIIWIVSTIICAVTVAYFAADTLRKSAATLRGILLFAVLFGAAACPYVNTVLSFFVVCFFADQHVKPVLERAWDSFWSKAIWDKPLFGPFGKKSIN